VVSEDTGWQVRVEIGQRGQDRGTASGMSRDRSPLLARESRSLVYDIEQRLVDLADVVEQRHPLDLVLHGVIGSAHLGQNECVAGHSAHVRPCFGVRCIDRVEQRFGQRSGQAFGASPTAALPREQCRAERGRRCAQGDRRPLGKRLRRARRTPGSSHSHNLTARPNSGITGVPVDSPANPFAAGRPLSTFQSLLGRHTAAFLLSTLHILPSHDFRPPPTSGRVAVVAPRAVTRLARGHPWIYRSDVLDVPTAPAGPVAIQDGRGRPLGWALWSPQSQIALRALDRDPNAHIDTDWWRRRIGAAIERRCDVARDATAYRVVHAEGDGAPSLICDRYDRWLVVQLLSAGLEACRPDIVLALSELLQPSGILARHDVAVRAKEGLPTDIEVLSGNVPREISVVEHGVRYLAAPWDGQKTGAFLDQRENRALVGELARGRALDCFSYHGSFALHLARRASRVTALDSSGPALARARVNAVLNDATNIDFVEADAFAFLKAAERARDRYDVIVLDPPAFAKTRSAVPDALRGYKEINLRAMRLLSPGGVLYTASCSFHVGRAMFLDMLMDAAADSGRRLSLRRILAQASDHPELLTVPETGYLKGALVELVE
jgi:23S rRNA (cytosine1962-C5)-methyltransferase